LSISAKKMFDDKDGYVALGNGTSAADNILDE
jgi:hypothetical protein